MKIVLNLPEKIVDRYERAIEEKHPENVRFVDELRATTEPIDISDVVVDMNPDPVSRDIWLSGIVGMAVYKLFKKGCKA